MVRYQLDHERLLVYKEKILSWLNICSSSVSRTWSWDSSDCIVVPFRVNLGTRLNGVSSGLAEKPMTARSLRE